MFLPARSLVLVATASAALTFGKAARAQPADVPPPRILFDSPGGAEIVEDFNTVMDLAGPEAAAERATLLDILEGFLVGLDRSRPIRLEPLTDTSPTRYRLYVPVADRREWSSTNLDYNSGIPSAEMARPRGTYRLGGVRDATYNGYMRYYTVDTAGGPVEYAVVADLIEDLPEPGDVKSIGALLKEGEDGVMYVRNKVAGDAAVAARWDRVETAREELTATFVQTPEETAEEFALRKQVAAFQVVALGRFYAEASVVLLRGEVSPGGAGAAGTAVFQPLRGTESEAAMNRIGDAPGRFAGVPFNEDAEFCGHMRYPLTPHEQTELRAFGETADEAMVAAVNDADMPQQERAARLRGFEQLFELADGVVDGGVVDTFAEAVSVDGQRLGVGAIALAEGADARPAVESFVASRGGRSAEMDAAEVEGVALHRVKLDQVFADALSDFIGTDEVWVGTAPGVIWYAAGPGARAALTERIEAAAAGGDASNEFARLSALPAVGADLLEMLSLADFAQYQEITQEVLEGCSGRLNVSLYKDDRNVIRGTATMPPCLLALVGRYMAEFSKANAGG